jgi:hypothetical protein
MAAAVSSECSKRKYPSDACNYHEKVDGRSTVITLNSTVAARFFKVKDSLSLNRGKPVSGSEAVTWLIEQSEQGLGAVQKENAKQAASARTPLPRRSRRISGEGVPAPSFLDLLSGISPSRVLSALRKKEGTVYDEELGFMDLDDDPDILEAIPEEIPTVAARSPKNKADPKVFLAETSKLLEFVKLFPPVCHARDCGQRMTAERVGHTHLTATLYLKCSDGHQALWSSAEEGTDSQVPQVVQRMFHGALCAGMGFTEFFEMATEVGFNPPSEGAWYAFQNGSEIQTGWMQAVLQVSSEDQAAVREFVKKRDGEAETVVYADARFDSSRDGFHGTVPVIDSESGKVLHCVTLTRYETGSSWKTEDACIRKAFEDLQAWEVSVSECVHVASSRKKLERLKKVNCLPLQKPSISRISTP